MPLRDIIGLDGRPMKRPDNVMDHHRAMDRAEQSSAEQVAVKVPGMQNNTSDAPTQEGIELDGQAPFSPDFIWALAEQNVWTREGDLAWSSLTAENRDFEYAIAARSLRRAAARCPTQEGVGREEIARIIYEQAFERTDGLPKPTWVPGGNATKQDDARRVADAILSLLPAPKPGEGGECIREGSRGIFENGRWRVALLSDPVSPLSAGLHPETANLVHSFAIALAHKLVGAQEKYGYSDGWRETDWEEKCRADLLEHVYKGDPLDVAAYAAFCWAHSWSTAPEQPAPGAPEASKEIGLNPNRANDLAQKTAPEEIGAPEGWRETLELLAAAAEECRGHAIWICVTDGVGKIHGWREITEDAQAAKAALTSSSAKPVGEEDDYGADYHALSLDRYATICDAKGLRVEASGLRGVRERLEADACKLEALAQFNRRLREGLEVFARVADNPKVADFDDEKVVRLVYDDPEWGDNTVLTEWFMRPFRQARAALKDNGHG